MMCEKAVQWWRGRHLFAIILIYISAEDAWAVGNNIYDYAHIRVCVLFTQIAHGKCHTLGCRKAQAKCALLLWWRRKSSSSSPAYVLTLSLIGSMCSFYSFLSHFPSWTISDDNTTLIVVLTIPRELSRVSCLSLAEEEEEEDRKVCRCWSPWMSNSWHHLSKDALLRYQIHIALSTVSAWQKTCCE